MIFLIERPFPLPRERVRVRGKSRYCRANPPHPPPGAPSPKGEGRWCTVWDKGGAASSNARQTRTHFSWPQPRKSGAESRDRPDHPPSDESPVGPGWRGAPPGKMRKGWKRGSGGSEGVRRVRVLSPTVRHPLHRFAVTLAHRGRWLCACFRVHGLSTRPRNFPETQWFPFRPI